MRTPEGSIKLKVKRILFELGAYFVMPSTGGYGSSGAPDFIFCLRGRFMAIECKANGNKPTALQEKNLGAIRHAEGITWVIDETNVDDLRDLIQSEFNTRKEGLYG